MKQENTVIEVPKNMECIEYKQHLSLKQKLFVILIIFLAAFIMLSVHWICKNTGNVTLEQLIFHLKVPIKGTNIGMILDYIYWTFSRIILVVIATCIILHVYEQKSKKNQSQKQKISYFLAKTILIFNIISVVINMNVLGFAKNQIKASTLIENEYIDPVKVNIEFPEQKQNLIYIYLESVENTFTSIENGGLYEADRMPELTQIAKKNINFSNTNNLGGAYNLKGTNWTIAAMASQTSGLPLKITIGDNDYGRHATFLPGAYTLGEVLAKNGYKNYLLIGSDSEFGGRKSYFESHGDYKIWDYCSAIEENRMSEDEKVWWGYSDNDLFRYAKEQLTEISKKDQPFNYTMLTVDTHFTDGYKCPNCKDDFEDQYSNVIRCSSKQVSDFVNWIQKQAFYKDTTIIISGDHLTMQSEIEEQANKNNYGERTIYNAFINSKVDTEQEIRTNNRQFFTMDMYPTTLAALGAKIEGNKLGLGTNLFSDEETIAEKYGIEYVRTEIEKKSVFYNKKIIYNQ